MANWESKWLVFEILQDGRPPSSSHGSFGKSRSPTPARRRRRTHDLMMKRFLAFFACALLSVCCLTSLSLFCFQGFHAWGFNLDVSLMHWVGGATVGAVATLATTVYRAFFKDSEIGEKIWDRERRDKAAHCRGCEIPKGRRNDSGDKGTGDKGT